jgi:hypothetical protein
MPDSVINRIEVMVKEDKRSGNMIFYDRKGNAMPDDDTA